jgi:hypothetical protein
MMQEKSVRFITGKVLLTFQEIPVILQLINFAHTVNFLHASYALNCILVSSSNVALFARTSGCWIQNSHDFVYPWRSTVRPVAIYAASPNNIALYLVEKADQLHTVG